MIAVFARDMHEIDGLYIGEFDYADVKQLEESLKTTEVYFGGDDDPYERPPIERQWVPGKGDHVGRLVLELVFIDSAVAS